MNETEKIIIFKKALLNAVVDDDIVTNRYEAIRYCYHYFRISGEKSVPLWCFDYVDRLYWQGYFEE